MIQGFGTFVARRRNAARLPRRRPRRRPRRGLARRAPAAGAGRVGARDRAGDGCCGGGRRDSAGAGDAAAAVHRRRLRRLLLLARARDEPRPDVPARLGATAAELAPPAGRLPRPRGHGRRQRHARSAAAGAGKAAGRRRPRVRPVPAPRHRARARLRRRDAQQPRRARPDRRFRRPRLRRRPRQRLERPRHPGVGVRAARAVPRQELRHVDLRLGDAAGAAGRPPRRGAAAGSGAAAPPSRRRRLGPRHPARGRAERRHDLARKRARRSTGRCRSSWRTRPRTARASAPAT